MAINSQHQWQTRRLIGTDLPATQLGMQMSTLCEDDSEKALWEWQAYLVEHEAPYTNEKETGALLALGLDKIGDSSSSSCAFSL